jgi:hypothetical protein
VQTTTEFDTESLLFYQMGVDYFEDQRFDYARAAFEIYKEKMDEEQVHGPDRKNDFHLRYLALAKHMQNKSWQREGALGDIMDRVALIAHDRRHFTLSYTEKSFTQKQDATWKRKKLKMPKKRLVQDCTHQWCCYCKSCGRMLGGEHPYCSWSMTPPKGCLLCKIVVNDDTK